MSRHEADRYFQTQRSYVESTLVITAALAEPGIASLSVFSNTADKVVWLKEHLHVTFPNGGEIMQISVADDKAPKEDLLALANAVSKSYFDEVVFREQAELTMPLQILKASLERLSSQVRNKMETLHQLEADSGHDAESLAKRQWLKDEAWLLRQRVEELRTQHFDEKLRRLRTDQDSQEDDASAKAKETEAKRAAIDRLFADEEKRLKAQLDETLGTSTAIPLSRNTDLDLRRQEIELLKETENWIARRIQLLQIETQVPNRVHAIRRKGDESAVAEFYDK